MVKNPNCYPYHYGVIGIQTISYRFPVKIKESCRYLPDKDCYNTAKSGTEIKEADKEKQGCEYLIFREKNLGITIEKSRAVYFDVLFDIEQ